MSISPELIQLPLPAYHHQLLEPQNFEFLVKMFEQGLPVKATQLSIGNSEREAIAAWNSISIQIQALNEPFMWELAEQTAALSSTRRVPITEAVVKPNSKPIRTIARITGAGILKGSTFLEGFFPESDLSLAQQISLQAVKGIDGRVSSEFELKERALYVFGSKSSPGNLETTMSKNEVLVQQDVFLDVVRIWSSARFQ